MHTGPKMYNAMASYEAENSKGSTRLHMDMADAINIMLFAANTPDGRPGCAAWDLFRSEDSAKLRKFLRRKFKGQYTNDPIHSQICISRMSSSTSSIGSATSSLGLFISWLVI